jgi:hypothetical protein
MTEMINVLPARMKEASKTLLFINSTFRISIKVRFGKRNREKTLDSSGVTIRDWKKDAGQSLEVNTREFLVFKYIGENWEDNDEIYFSPLDVHYLIESFKEAIGWINDVNIFNQNRNGEWVFRNPKKKKIISYKTASRKALGMIPKLVNDEELEQNVPGIGIYFDKNKQVEISGETLWGITKYIEKIDINMLGMQLVCLVLGYCQNSKQPSSIDPELEFQILEAEVNNMSLEEIIEFCKRPNIGFSIGDPKEWKDNLQELRETVTKELKEERIKG